MSNQNDSTGAGQTRLDEAIAQILRHEAEGSMPDKEALLRRFPELAEELREFLNDHADLNELMEPLRAGTDDGSGRDPAEVDLPDMEETLSFTASLPELATARYRLKEMHARGGMGEVWLAHDSVIGREVALKKIRQGKSHGQERFLVEAQITGQLEHPSIIPLYDLCSDRSGAPYYIMKFLRGQSLKEAIRDYHASPETESESREVRFSRLLNAFLDLCQAVAYAHSRGVLHRDLKPDNVMLGSYGETILLDWGLAKVHSSPERDHPPGYVELSTSGSAATQANTIIGSPPYMSPEAASCNVSELDEVSDVYLLGATLYDILTGQPPHRGSSKTEMEELARSSEPLPPRKVNPSVPRALNAICIKAMSHRKQDRYASALALANDMQKYLAGDPVSAYREPLAARGWRWCKKHHRTIRYSLVAAAFMGLVLLTFSSMRKAHLADLLQSVTADGVRFDKLIAQTWFYISSIDPISEHAPYYEPKNGKEAGQKAIALAEDLQPRLERLGMSDQRDQLANDLYDLHLLLVQSKSQQVPKDDAGIKKLLDELESALEWRSQPTASYHRLRAALLEQLPGEKENAAKESQLAQSAEKVVLDHFLDGENSRMQAARHGSAEVDGSSWKARQADLEDAIRHYKLAIKDDPEHYWSHFQRGRCLMGLGRTAEAVETLSVCIALKPDVPWGYSARGMAWAQLGQFNEARADLQQALELDREFHPARLNLGVVQWLEDRKDTSGLAIKSFTAVLDDLPEQDRLYEAAYYRGQIYLERADYDAAMEDFALVQKNKPGLLHVYLLRVVARLRQEGNRLLRDEVGLTEVMDGLNQYLGIQGGAEAPLTRARILRRLAANSPPSDEQIVLLLAESQLKEAEEQNLTSVEFYLEKGNLLRTLGQYDEAIEALTKGIDMEKEPNLELHLARGWAHFAKNNITEARADFLKAFQAQAASPQQKLGCVGASIAIGNLDAQSQNSEEAELTAIRALALLEQYGVDHYVQQYNLACIYGELSKADNDRKTHNQQTAILLLRRALKLARQADSEEKVIPYIEADTAFPQELRDLPAFKALLKRSQL